VTTPSPTTWVLLDSRAGNRTQAMGVAGRLGWPIVEKNIRYNVLAALPNAVLGAHTWHVTESSKRLLAAPFPELVISAGRRTAPIALAIRAQSPDTRLIHCMWPDISPHLFDLILAPEHDMHKRKGKNMLYTLGAPHGITHTKLAEEAKRWQKRVERLPHPHIALVIGGSARGGKYTLEDFKSLAAYATAEAERLGGSLLITSSPRTGKEGCAAIRKLLTVPHIFHEWKMGGENPYVAFLGLADAIIVTGDSISMCSEACSTGKPVYVFVPPHMGSAKQTFFRNALFARGHAKSHTFSIRLDWQPTPLPDAASVAAEMIRQHFIAT
jgi:uncharacterized protein